MLGRKKKQVIMSIESDGRVREFTSIDDACDLYQLTLEDIQAALDSKNKLKNIWFRRKAEKVVNKTRMV